jgi:hypothetical protein
VRKHYLGDCDQTTVSSLQQCVSINAQSPQTAELHQNVPMN